MPNKVSYYIKKEIIVVLVATFFGISFNLSDAYSAIALGKVIDSVDPDNGLTLHKIHMILLYYALLILFVNITRFGKRYFVRLFSHRVEKRMRKLLYNHLMSMTIVDFEKENMGNLMSRCIGDVSITTDGYRKVMMETYDTGIRLAFILTMLYIYSWKITTVIVLICPIVIIIAISLKKLIHKYSSEARAYSSYMNNSTYDLIDNSILYRTYGSIDNEIRNYNLELDELKKKEIKANFFENALEPLYKIFVMLALFYIMLMGARNVNSGIWTTGLFVSYLALSIEIFRKVSRTSILINMVEKASISFERLKPYLVIDEMVDDSRKFEVGNLEVNNLNIRVGATPLINNLTFDAKPGEIVGITGRVGSGKSTLGLALTALYPYNGSIKLNGVELRDLNNKEKSKIISYLGHNPYLISDTITNNISFGHGDINDVLADVAFTKDLELMSNGYNTTIGNHGVRLSGGQGQRIALARALYKKNNLIILDDPFSASDFYTEEEIIKNIKSNYKNSIIILFSHRLRIFPLVDKVICLDGGKYNIGSHDELYRKSSLYKEIFDEQRGDNRG